MESSFTAFLKSKAAASQDLRRVKEAEEAARKAKEAAAASALQEKQDAELAERRAREERKRRELELLQEATQGRLKAAALSRAVDRDQRESSQDGPRAASSSTNKAGGSTQRPSKAPLSQAEKRKRAIFSESPPPSSSSKRHNSPSVASKSTIKPKGSYSAKSTTSAGGGGNRLATAQAKHRAKRLVADFDPTQVIALNTVKRDTRTIEEIERDMRLRRGDPKIKTSKDIKSASDYFIKPGGSNPNASGSGLGRTSIPSSQKTNYDGPSPSKKAKTVGSSSATAVPSSRNGIAAMTKNSKQINGRGIPSKSKRSHSDVSDDDEYESDSPQTDTQRAKEAAIRARIRSMVRGNRGDYAKDTDSEQSQSDDDESQIDERRRGFAELWDEEEEADRISRMEEAEEMRREKARIAAKKARLAAAGKSPNKA